jgi:predicted transcriptional regulator
MSDPVDIRPDVHRLIDALPASASWDDVAYEIYVRQAVDQGVADANAEAGRLHSHDDAMARVRARIRRAS